MGGFVVCLFGGLLCCDFCCLFVLCIFWLVGGWLGGQGWGLGVGVSPIEEAARFCAGNPHCSDIHFCSDSLCATMNTRSYSYQLFSSIRMYIYFKTHGRKVLKS